MFDLPDGGRVEEVVINSESSPMSSPLVVHAKKASNSKSA